MNYFQAKVSVFQQIKDWSSLGKTEKLDLKKVEEKVDMCSNSISGNNSYHQMLYFLFLHLCFQPDQSGNIIS